MGLTAHSSWKFKVPTGFGIHHTMNPDPYKGIFGGKNCRDSPVQVLRNCKDFKFFNCCYFTAKAA